MIRHQPDEVDPQTSDHLVSCTEDLMPPDGDGPDACHLDDRDDPTGLDAMPSQADCRYQFIRQLGRGGMGVVHLAHDRLLDRPVAMKCLADVDDRRLANLRREARVLAKLDHPKVLGVHDIATVEGESYIVCEYVEGRGLDTVATPVPWSELLQYSLEIAEALAAVHEHHVLHRDIKPANVLITSDQHLKLIDFGLAESWNPDATPSPQNSTGFTGTASYMAPELWTGHRPSNRSDVYSCGIVLYWLATGKQLPAALDSDELRVCPLRSDELDSRFVAIVNRCLSPDPACRFESGVALHQALSSLTDSGVTSPFADSPYRGLRPFSAHDAHLFFGRNDDIERIRTALANQPLSLLVGDSGAGKSSLIKAGVLARIRAGTWPDLHGYRPFLCTPGTDPLAALAQVLASACAMQPSEVRAQLSASAFEPMRAALQRRHEQGRGTVLFIDQLEELATVSNPADVEPIGQLLADLVTRPVDRLRIVATLRNDYISRMAALPGFRKLIQHTPKHHVLPLECQAIREAVVTPAAQAGVSFADDAMVSELVEATHRLPGGLPLLQYALAELWRRRDPERRVLTRDALRELGGLAGALGRQADAFCDSLDEETARVARRVLVDLVTPEGTRCRRALADLRELVEESSRRLVPLLLDQMVRERLLVGHNRAGRAEYELIHDAMIGAWPRLQLWLNAEKDSKYIRDKLLTDAREWTRRGWQHDDLWGRRRLQEAQILDARELPLPARKFLRASHRALRRRRRIVGLAIALLVLLLSASYIAIELRATWARERHVDELVAHANRELAAAQVHSQAFRRERKRLHDAWRTQRSAGSTEEWRRALVSADRADLHYRQARAPLEQAVSLDPRADRVQRSLAEVLDGHAHLAHVLGDGRRRDEYLQRLASVAPGQYRNWRQPRTIEITVEPSGATLAVERVSLEPNKLARRALHETIESVSGRASLQLPPDSWLVTVSWPDRSSFRMHYPLLVTHARTIDTISIQRPVDISLWDVGFVYIAPGPFLFGFGTSRDHEDKRDSYKTLPLHERNTDGFWIARRETTIRQWLEFFADTDTDTDTDACPTAYTSAFMSTATALRCGLDGSWSIEWSHSDSGTARATQDGRLIYAQRTANHSIPWLDTPMVSLSSDDIAAYLGWLRRTGRAPGARLCREDEWERAARGADGRAYPHGNLLRPEHVNFDLTYGRVPGAYGPDVGGSRTISDSPFGVSDLAGNVWEIVQPVLPDGHGNQSAGSKFIARGGSFFHDRMATHMANRVPTGEATQLPFFGLRVCADPR